jgi:CubicO group peptidase (beta-lactamase class C family)
MGTDNADPDLMKWSHAVGRKSSCMDYTIDGWCVPLRFPPGEGWYYGGATELAGVAVERISGMNLSDYMAESVYKPLDMRDTTFYRQSLEERAADRAAACCSRDPETGVIHIIPTPVPADPPLLSLGSGLYMTAADHIKALQSLLRSGAGDGGLLSKETVDEMFRPQLKDSQRAVLKMVTDMFHNSMVPEFPAGMPLDHGISGIINLEDTPGKRRKGSMMWHGMANGRWVGVCKAFTTSSFGVHPN